MRYPVPLHRSPAYRTNVRLPHTDTAAGQVLSLPVHTGLSSYHLDRIVAAVMPDPTSAGSATRRRVGPSWRVASPTGWLRALAAVFAVPVGTLRLQSCPTCGRQLLGGRGGPAVTATGRCTDCGVRVGPGPWLMEITLLAAIAVVLLGRRSGSELPAYLWFAVFGVVLAFVDATVRRLPNFLTAAWAVGTLAALGLPALTQDRTGDWLRALLGGIVLIAAFGLLALLRPPAMGWGDGLG